MINKKKENFLPDEWTFCQNKFKPDRLFVTIRSNVGNDEKVSTWKQKT